MKRIQFLSLLWLIITLPFKRRNSGYERHLGPDRRGI